VRAHRSLRRRLLAAAAVLALAVVVLNWTYGRLPPTPPASGRFVAVDGVRIRYLERPGREPAVLLIHGLPGTAEDFERVSPLIAGRREIAIDRPGFGFSSGGYFPFDRQLRVLAGVLASLGVRRPPILVGHSYGGTVALGYAELHPGGVAGLVLVDAAAACTHNSYLERARARLVRLLELPVIAQLADVTFSQLLRKASAEAGESEAFDPDRVVERHRERVLAINLKHGNLEAYAGEVIAANGVVARVNRGLHALAVPTVVIQGAKDQLVKPECGRRLAASVPGASLQMVSGGHMAPYTHPAAVAGAVTLVAGHAAARERTDASARARPRRGVPARATTGSSR
jgi:pimeloyl-ACP methyl ester carboxylesterase